MKKLVLACTLLLMGVALTTPAQALPICFKWVAFCDGVQVNSQGLGGAMWYHWDCALNSSMDFKLFSGVTPIDPCNPWPPNCPKCGLIRSVTPNGPGDYYFLVKTPLTGTLDMAMGTYPNGSCWIPELAYNLQMGSCTGIDGANPRSTVQ